MNVWRSEFRRQAVLMSARCLKLFSDWKKQARTVCLARSVTKTSSRTKHGLGIMPIGGKRPHFRQHATSHATFASLVPLSDTLLLIVTEHCCAIQFNHSSIYVLFNGTINGIQPLLMSGALTSFKCFGSAQTLHCPQVPAHR